MKTDIIINEGFASAINDGIRGLDDKTISYHVLPIVFRNLDADKWIEIWSTRVRSRKIMRGFIYDNHPTDYNDRKNLLIICKSMGVVETYDVLDEMWEAIRHYNHIGLVCIDGHSKLLKELFKRRYGEKRDFYRRDDWGDKVTVYNFFQHNKYPKGAQFVGADYEYSFTNKQNEGDPGLVDHFSIIYQTPVLDAVESMCQNMIDEGSDKS